MTDPESMLRRTPRHAEAVWLERLDGRNVLYEGRAHRLCVVNDTAAALWELCDGVTTVDEMVEAIRQYWSVDPGAVVEEVLRALAELEAAGALDQRRT